MTTEELLTRAYILANAETVQGRFISFVPGGRWEDDVWVWKDWNVMVFVSKGPLKARELSEYRITAPTLDEALNKLIYKLEWDANTLMNRIDGALKGEAWTGE